MLNFKIPHPLQGSKTFWVLIRVFVTWFWIESLVASCFGRISVFKIKFTLQTEQESTEKSA